MKIENNSPQPFLIIGMGNPGRKHALNRHNVGFMLVDVMAEKLGISFSKVEKNALVSKGMLNGHQVILAKPQTFMNHSGDAVGPLAHFYKIPLSHLLVNYDDLDIPLGTLRLRPFGGSGGHWGMQSVIEKLGTQDFPRLRIGIGRPPGFMDPAQYVLQDFTTEEKEILTPTLQRASEAVCTFITQGIEETMTTYNRESENR
ncbi:MAG: aminoacyl-tRNA hydrolase [Chloroflexota bacterium]